MVCSPVGGRSDHTADVNSECTWGGAGQELALLQTLGQRFPLHIQYQYQALPDVPFCMVGLLLCGSLVPSFKALLLNSPSYVLLLSWGYVKQCPPHDGDMSHLMKRGVGWWESLWMAVGGVRRSTVGLQQNKWVLPAPHRLA